GTNDHGRRPVVSQAREGTTTLSTSTLEIALNDAVGIKAVGFCVACLSHPVNGFPVVSTCTRRVLATRLHSSSASNNTSPRASIRSGFFRNRLLTISGSFKKP